MKTLVGAAEPEPRPYPFAFSATSSSTSASTSYVVVSTTQPTYDQRPIPLTDPREPYRTQAYVDRRPELEAEPNGVPKEEPSE